MKVANIISVILFLVFLILGMQWLTNPSSAAESLSMIYLDGDGRNTQIRDFAALFISSSIFALISLLTKQYQWIFCVGIIYFIAAISGITAGIFYNAPISYSSLISEIIFAMSAFFAAYKFNTYR